MVKDILLFSILVFYVVGGIYWIIANFTGAPYYPTSKKTLQTIIDFLKTQKSHKAIELGSGDGRVSIAVARLNIDATAVDINPVLTVVTRLKKLIYRLKNLHVLNKNFFSIDMSKYDLVFTYLYPKTMDKLEQKLYKEMKPGSLIISNTFQFKNKKPLAKLENKIFVYKV